MTIELGKAYRRARDDAGLSRKEVAERTGVTQAQLARVEARGVVNEEERAALDGLYGQVEAAASRAPEHVDTLGSPSGGPGNRVEFTSWGAWRTGDLIKPDGWEGAYKFDAYVIPLRGPAYVTMYGGRSGRPLARRRAPERIKGRPNRRYSWLTDATGQDHQVPGAHLEPVALRDGHAKARCGAWVTGEVERTGECGVCRAWATTTPE